MYVPVIVSIFTVFFTIVKLINFYGFHLSLPLTICHINNFEKIYQKCFFLVVYIDFIYCYNRWHASEAVYMITS